MTVREIRGFLAERYAVAVSPDLISTGTDGIVEEVTTGQNRPLERVYPVVFFDALRVKIRDEAIVRRKAVYLALAVCPDGSRDILGRWIEQTEGAKFWMKVFADLETPGCEDILIAVTDGLKGMSEALGPVYPATTWQTCIVHLIRYSVGFGNWKERKSMRRPRGPSTPRPARRRVLQRWTRLSAVPGARNSRRSWRPGDAPGPTSFHSSPSYRRSVV
jgi:transposase-like protein